MQHPDEGLIHAWLDGELGEKEAARVAALVQADPAWSAAAAEARGLVAASSRIVKALDRGSVMVQTPAGRRATTRRWWTIRAAAALLVMVTAAALVRERWFNVKSPAEKAAGADDRASVPATPSGKTLASAPPVPEPTSARREAVEAPKPRKAEVRVAEPSATQGAAGSTNAMDRAIAAAPPTPAPRSPAPKALAVGAATGELAAAVEARQGRPDMATARREPAAQAKVIAADVGAESVRCFRMSQPPDSAGKVLRLTEAFVAEGVRKKSFVIRGDTLTNTVQGLVAHAVPCVVPEDSGN